MKWIVTAHSLGDPESTWVEGDDVAEALAEVMPNFEGYDGALTLQLAPQDEPIPDGGTDNG